VSPKVEYAMQTSDGAWRVDIVRRGPAQWYRVVHGDSVIDWLSIASVRRILGEAGIDLADLAEVGTFPPVDGGAGHGAA
jgi:hypothetical protein